MDKRKFLKSTLAGAGVVGVPAAAGAQTRLFGTPGSVIPINPLVPNRLRLAMSRVNIPPAAWDMIVNAALAIDELVTSRTAQHAFANAPGRYFAERGVPDGSFAPHSRDVAMARLAMDDTAKQAAARGDYTAFLQRLREFHLGTLPDPNGLVERITDLLKGNAKFYASLKGAFDRAGGPGPEELADAIARPKLLFEDEDEIVAIDTDVLVMETAVAMIHVVVGAEVVVLAAVVAAIVLFVAGNPDAPLPTRREGAYEPKLAKLDPNLLEFANTATMGARLLGNRDFEISIAKDVVRREIEALFTASASLGLLKVTPDKHGPLVDFAVDKAYEGLGLA
jgi:hypothetical protein